MNDEDRDRIDEAFAAWRAATDGIAPPAGLLDAVTRATATPPPTVLGALWGLGRPAFVGLAMAAALLVFAATRSVQTLEARAGAAVEAMLP